MKVSLSLIDFPRDDDGSLLNPRGERYDTDDLKFSMALIGQQDPVRLYPDGDRYKVKDGHRRITTARALGWTEIEAVIDNTPTSTSDLLVFMLAADVRAKLPPSARARSYKRLLADVSWGIERLARAVGMKAEQVELHLALLDAPETVQKRIDAGEMSWSAFKALRDAPKAVQEEAAALPKPTVSNVRQAVRKARETPTDAEQTHISATLGAAAKAEPIAVEFGAVARKVIAAWDTLSELEQVRILTQAESILELATVIKGAKIDLLDVDTLHDGRVVVQVTVFI